LITEFSTVDLDLAAAIMTATDKQPEVFQQPGQSLVSFEFPYDKPTQTTILAYSGGELVQPVKRFAACRAWLYRRAKGVK